MSSKSLTAFIEWLDTLPLRDKQNIAHLTSAFIPGCNIETINRNVCEQFIEWIKIQSLHPTKSIGVALSLQSIINFTIMNAITGPQQWKTQVHNVNLLIKSIKEKEHGEESIQKLLDHKQQLQFLSAQSWKMKKSWILLCDKHFNDVALRKE